MSTTAPQPYLSSRDADDPFESSTRGVGLKISLVCPGCGDAGWVEWQNLSRGMHCRKCGCRFAIDRSGHLATRAAAALRYKCPRCGHVGPMASTALDAGITCGGCTLTLIRGHDNQLHGPGELLPRVAPPPTADVPKRSPRALGGRGRLAATSTAAFMLVALLLVYSMSGSSPQSRVADFTAACLAGRSGGAEGFLVTNATQRAEFFRWRTRYFASIEDGLRPPGDRVSIVVTTLRVESRRRFYRVECRSPFVGVRRHVQCWRLVGDEWRFDAAATLTEQDRQAPLTAGR